MKSKLILAALTTSVLLAACGGGGGGSSSGSTGGSPVGTTPTPNPAPTPTPTPAPTPTSDLQTSVPALTYAANSQEAAFVTLYNDFRAKLGLGLLAQDARLDLAARNHLAYQVQNPDVDYSSVDPKTGRAMFHIEDPARPGFTGATELERAQFAKYPGAYVGESGSYGLNEGSARALNDLIGTVYHRSALMYQFPRDIGVAVGTDKYQTIAILFGYQTKQQVNAPDYVGVYPADKQTGIPLTTVTEVPNPFPEITLGEYATKTSYPINVITAKGTTLAVTTFTVTEAGAAAPLSNRLMTKDTDPNKYLEANTAFWIGNAPFKAATTYTAKFSGTVNGVAFTKTWSFTTK